MDSQEVWKVYKLKSTLIHLKFSSGVFIPKLKIVIIQLTISGKRQVSLILGYSRRGSLHRCKIYVFFYELNSNGYIL